LTCTCTLGVTVTLGTATVPRAEIALGSIAAARCRAFTARSAPSQPVLRVPRVCSTNAVRVGAVSSPVGEFLTRIFKPLPEAVVQ
jgi:hypothetical protein